MQNYIGNKILQVIILTSTLLINITQTNITIANELSNVTNELVQYTNKETDRYFTTQRTIFAMKLRYLEDQRKASELFRIISEYIYSLTEEELYNHLLYFTYERRKSNKNTYNKRKTYS